MAEYNEKFENERHTVIDEKLKEHGETLNSHESRIGSLEKSDVKQESNMSNLCDKIDKLISQNNKWFYALVTGMATLLIKILFFK